MEYTKTVYKTNKEIVEELLDTANDEGYLTDLEFSVLIQNLLISQNGYVVDVGNNGQVNAEVALRLERKIKKHPKLWKWLFMVV